MPFLVKEKTLNKVIQVETAKIDPNPYQPRREFDDIDGLAQSISQNGILQPLTEIGRASCRERVFILV